MPSLPAHTVFVSITVDMNLTTGMASARLDNASANIAISPSAAIGQPSAIFGIFDPLGSGGAHVAFDNVLVVTTP